MVKSVVTGVHPETNEQVIHEMEGEAICTVTVKHRNGSVEVNNSIVGSMDATLTELMIDALIGACHEILKGVDPMLAALILMKGIKKHNGEEKADGMAGESSEPERPTEQ